MNRVNLYVVSHLPATVSDIVYLGNDQSDSSLSRVFVTSFLERMYNMPSLEFLAIHRSNTQVAGDQSFTSFRTIFFYKLSFKMFKFAPFTTSLCLLLITSIMAAPVPQYVARGIHARQAPAIFPQKSPEDAPYTQSEDTLKAAIKFPATFTAGQKIPVIMAPGYANLLEQDITKVSIYESKHCF